MFGAIDRLRQGLRKTRDSIVGRLGELFAGKVRLDAATLDEIEALLISADLGVKASTRIVQSIEKRLKDTGGEATLESVTQVIRADIAAILREAKPRVKVRHWDEVADAPARGRKGRAARSAQEASSPPPPPGGVTPPAGPRVIFVVGVNGTGKTTSIAKLAYAYQQEGHRVLLAAGDTFRAAAVEQLRIWADRIGVDFVTQGQGADAAAVVHDALSAAEARGHDIVIVDTAGRLHTKSNLMDELGKVARVIRRKSGRDPETLLVVDANTGQNGLQQAKIFAETVPVDGLILTKLDGTAKGGIVVAIAETLGLPVRYVGIGEQPGDLAVFDPEAFAEALFTLSDPADAGGDAGGA
jgi:fused signal recognition particle receptor